MKSENKDEGTDGPKRRILRHTNRQDSETISVSDLVSSAMDKGGIQGELEREKQHVAKLQRINEKVMKQLEDSSLRVASSEVQYRTNERSFKDKEAELVIELKKLRSEIDREREEFKDQMAKVNEKIEYKEKVVDSKLADRNRQYQLRINALKIDIEEAQKRLKDNEKIKNLESSIRKMKDEKGLIENNSRKLESQLASINSEILQEKETITEYQQQAEETEKSNKQLSDLDSIKDSLQSECSQLTKKMEEYEKEIESGKDSSEKMIEAKANLRNLKNKNDDMVNERERLEKNLARIKAGMDPLEEGERDRGNVSRVARIEKESAYDKYRGARGATDDRRTAAESRQSREDEKRIRDLKSELKTIKRDKEREVETWNKKLTTAESNVTKAKAELSKLEEEKKSLQKLIKQERELQQSNMTLLNDQIQYFTKRKDQFETELKKTKKAYQDLEFNVTELKTQVEDSQKVVSSKTQYLNDIEINKTQTLRNVERTEKDLATEQKNYNALADKLLETKISLLSFQQMVITTREEFKVTREDMLQDVHTLEAEIYDQTDQNEILDRVKEELTQEVNSLNWYFRPAKEKGELETQWFSTTDYDFIVLRKAKREAELQSIKEEIQNTSLDYLEKEKEAEDFKKTWERALEAMNVEDRGDLLYELKDLMEAFKIASFKQRTVLQIVSLLTEQQVYPGAVRELALLTKTMKERDYHVMQRPDILLKVTFREFKRDQISKSFRRRLFEKLVSMRMKRTNKSIKKCENFIFYGEELEGEEEV